MVVQKTINNLKDRPHDERKAVAGGIAIFVIVVLLGAWSLSFLKKIQSGAQSVNFDTGAQSDFNPSSVRAAQQAIQQSNSQDSNTQELYQIRQDSAANTQGAQQLQIQQVGSGQDAFGNPASY